MKNTCYVSVLSDCGRFELSDLYKVTDKKYVLYKTPVLTIFDDYISGVREEIDIWDNDDYLRVLFKDLKKGKKKTTHIKELKSFCKKKGFDYSDTRKSLLSIYKESKKLKMW